MAEIETVAKGEKRLLAVCDPESGVVLARVANHGEPGPVGFKCIEIAAADDAPLGHVYDEKAQVFAKPPEKVEPTDEEQVARFVDGMMLSPVAAEKLKVRLLG